MVGWSASGGVTNVVIHQLDEDWDEDKDRIENNVADFPEDAARWTGEKVWTSSEPSLI